MLARLDEWAFSVDNNCEACPDPAVWERFRSRFAMECMRLPAATPGTLDHLELSHVKKTIPESGGPYRWHARLSKRARSGPLSGEVLSVIKALLTPQSGAALSSVVPYKTSVPRGTNHGWPTWRSDPLDHAIHLAAAHEIKKALMGGGGTGVASSVLEEMAAISGLTGELAQPLLTLLTRTGPIAKPQPQFLPGEGGVVEVGETLGLFCRRRDVNGVPTVLNDVARDEIMRLTTLLKRHPTFNHGPASVDNAKIVAALRPGGRIYSDDASAFDDTISLDHLRQVAAAYPSDAVCSRWLHRVTDSAPLLAPAVRSGFEARLVQREGTMASGLVYTSLEDSLINVAVVLESLAAGSGRSVNAIVQGFWAGDFLILAQGDDTLIVWNGPPLDEAAYTARAAELGYTRKLEGYPVFLMVYHTRRGYFNLAGRAAMRTVAREHRPATRALELFGSLARWTAAEACPTRDAWWATIADNPLFAAYHVRTYQSLKAVVASTPFQTQLARDLRSLGAAALRDLRRALENAEDLGLLSREALDGLRAAIARGEAPSAQDVLDEAGLDFSWRKALEETVVRKREDITFQKGIPFDDEADGNDTAGDRSEDS